MATIRLLDRDAVDRLEAFCQAEPYERVFLRQQLRAWDTHLRVAALEERGAIRAVVTRAGNGMLLVTGAPIAPLARLGAGTEPVAGLLGPEAGFAEARQALGLAERPFASRRTEEIFGLELADLTGIPEAVASGRVTVRTADAGHAEELIAMRMEFRREVFGLCGGREQVEQEVRDQLARAALWVALEAGEIRATASFHLQFPGLVVLGGGWVRPELRSRGYVRCVVAGSLLAARSLGVARAGFFTSNPASGGAVTPLGFRVRGTYAIGRFTAGPD